jgi:hypothetical protein
MITMAVTIMHPCAQLCRGVPEVAVPDHPVALHVLVHRCWIPGQVQPHTQQQPLPLLFRHLCVPIPAVGANMVGSKLNVTHNERKRETIPRHHLKENGLVLEFSLCLSRACLGKKIVLYTNGSKGSFSLTASHQENISRSDSLRPVGAAQPHPGAGLSSEPPSTADASDGGGGTGGSASSGLAPFSIQVELYRMAIGLAPAGRVGVFLRKTAFLSHLAIILLRQARDNHRENSEKDAVFRTGDQ